MYIHIYQKQDIYFLYLDANMLSNISKTGYNNSKVCPVKREFRLDRENYSIKTL